MSLNTLDYRSRRSARFRPRILSAAVLTTLFGPLAGCVDGGPNPPASNVQNSVPVANAGQDQTVVNQSLATVNAGGSTDADGDVLAYTWDFESKPAGSSAVLTDTDPGTPDDTRDPVRTFVPDIAGDYVVRVTVADGFPDSSSTDTVTITSVLGPVANAGPDQDVSFIVAGTTVNLDGTQSSDPTGQPLAYSWEILTFSGPPPAVSPVLIGADTATPTFDITALDQLGTYTLELTVDNGTLNATDQVQITVAKSFPAAGALMGGGAFAAAGAALRRRWQRRTRKARSAT
jgi:hypothetical protein